MSKNPKLIPVVVITCLITLSLWACTPTRPENKTGIEDKPTQSSSPEKIGTILLTTTNTPTQTPTQTCTELPMQVPNVTLVPHEWNPNEPVISFGGSGGDGGCFIDRFPESLTLFSDGSLFLFRWNYELRTYQILNTILPREKVCNLLNSIDKAGYFEYDPSTYFPPAYASDPQFWIPPIIGAGRINISVQAWHSNTVSLYGLGSFISSMNEYEGDPSYPVILPAIRKTYELLSEYQPDHLEIYQPERLGIWVVSSTDPSSAVAWPLTSYKLAGIISQTGEPSDEPNLILDGADAETIFQLFNQAIQDCGINIMEGDKTYTVFARPLLPNEFSSESPTSTSPLSCYPSDGWTEIP